MLSHLDETLLHQTSWPFRMAGLSDHRFFDRYWFEALDPSGEVALIAGMGLYKNTGVIDGYLSVQRDGRQHNARWSRAIGDTVDDVRLGPLQVQVVEPFRRLRLLVDENSSGVACDLEWTSDFPPYVEAHHLEHPGHRIVTDSTRYDQAGRWHGWVQAGGERTQRAHWWGARDHSWGVRPGVGGFEPTPGRGAGTGLLFIWNLVATDEYTLQFQLRETGDGTRLYLDGQLDFPTHDGRPSVRVVDVTHEITFVPGTRAYERAVYLVQMANGEQVHLEVQPMFRAWAYAGTGYDGGYDDRRGLGAWRGEVAEHDVYELPDPEQVLRDGAPTFPGHREQPAQVLINGRATLGHCPVMPFGRVDRYGLS